MKRALISMSVTTLLVAGSIPAQAQENMIYIPVNPCRLADTREPGAGGEIPADTSRRFLVSGDVSGQGGNAGGCPAPVTGVEPLAISAYVLAVPPSSAPSAQGVLTAFPSDQPDPAPGAGSTVNFSANQVIGNTTNITLCDPAGTCPTDGEFAILARASAEHVVVDVQGYFYPETGTCPNDMVAAGSLCVDIYEASVWSAPTGGSQFGVSSDDYPCLDDGSDCGASAANPIYARSVSDGSITASAFITQYQASQACANVGKRLPTTAEWQMAAAGTPTDLRANGSPCNTDTGAVEPTGSPGCVSNVGAFDMVGSLWEWAAELEAPQSGTFVTTDDTVARMLGQDRNNSGTPPEPPSSKSMMVLDGTGEVFDQGPNSGNTVMGFRCVR